MVEEYLRNVSLEQGERECTWVHIWHQSPSQAISIPSAPRLWSVHLTEAPNPVEMGFPLLTGKANSRLNDLNANAVVESHHNFKSHCIIVQYVSDTEEAPIIFTG